MDAVVFETDLGWTAFARTGRAVSAVVFGHRSQASAEKALCARMNAKISCHFLQKANADDLAGRLYCLAQGAPDNLDDVEIDFFGCTSFQRRVLDSCRAIPRGETRSYGDLAWAAGHPGAARAVGSVMAKNRTPLIVPCHRVVLASGEPGCFSAPQGERMRRKLLTLEAPCLTVSSSLAN